MVLLGYGTAHGATGVWYRSWCYWGMVPLMVLLGYGTAHGATGVMASGPSLLRQ